MSSKFKDIVFLIICFALCGIMIYSAYKFNLWYECKKANIWVKTIERSVEE